MTPVAIRVWAGLKEAGRCTACRQRVIWRVNTNGTNVPLNAGAEPLRSEIHEARQVRLDVFALDALHSRTCRGRTQKAVGAR